MIQQDLNQQGSNRPQKPDQNQPQTQQQQRQQGDRTPPGKGSEVNQDQKSPKNPRDPSSEDRPSEGQR